MFIINYTSMKGRGKVTFLLTKIGCYQSSNFGNKMC